MKKFIQSYGWIFTTIIGAMLFSLGFDLFLIPHGLNAGGVTGFAMVVGHMLGLDSFVGVISIIINLPLFILGGVKIGKRFFVGSLIGMAVSSVFIDVFALIPAPQVDVLLAIIYGSVMWGVGIGMVFASGASTGGSDIVVRLLKLRFRNVPVGQISMMIDLTVAVLTGIVFNNIVNTLYIGVAVFLTTKIMDMVIYRFDYSKVALIITKEHEKVAQVISDNLGRGATYLHGQGTYTGADTKVVLTAIKRQQLAELKDIVIQIDPNAFIIVQEAHQVLGDGFARHSKDSL
jgi:uncharacterized membrane-anchored protein YitT (DUF2179 family)